MSYSYSVPAGPAETFLERAKEAAQSSSIADDQRPGAEQAAALAADIVASGIVAADGTHVAASISGHVQAGGGSALPTCIISVRAEAPKREE